MKSSEGAYQQAGLKHPFFNLPSTEEVELQDTRVHQEEVFLGHVLGPRHPRGQLPPLLRGLLNGTLKGGRFHCNLHQ